MAEPFIGEIKMTAINFAQRDWAFCNGQAMAINQNQSLYSLLGTQFGGDGRTTFNLPDMRGRVPVHRGDCQGEHFYQGYSGGVEKVGLTVDQIPSHTHTVTGENSPTSGTKEPSNSYLAQSELQIYSNATDQTNVNMGDTAISSSGGSHSHYNMQPYSVVNFVISLKGLWPSRS